MTLTGQVTMVGLGDSILGAHGDDKGGLARALHQFMPKLGVEILEIVGVGGSQAGHWLATAGVEPIQGRGISRGRWGGAGRGLSADAIERADLDRLAGLNADLYWINLGTNDFHSGRTVEAFASNILDIIARLPPDALVIVSEGNDEPEKNAIKKRAYAALRRNAPSRVLVLDTADERRRPYIGGGLHPSVARHLAWLEIVTPLIASHILNQGSSDMVAKIAVMLLGALIGAGLAWYMTRER